MDAARRQRIKDSFNTLAPHGEALVNRFYERLFSEHPAVRPMFPDDMGQQKKHLLASLAVQWVRADATHLTLRLGPPLALDIPGTLDAPGGDTWTGTWGCPATLPFATDSTLLANGYLADSLQAGSLLVTRTTAVD